MNMKLSYRDKVIFIVVIVIIILVAGFFLLIRPKFEEIDRAKEAYDSKVSERDEIDAKIGTLPTIISGMQEVAKQVGEDQEIFFIEQDPYLNENYVRAMIDEVGATVVGMETQYAIADPITRYYVDPENILTYDNKMNMDLYNELPQEVWDEYNGIRHSTEFPEAVIGVTRMTINIVDADYDYETTFKLVDRIAEDEKSITLNTLNTESETSSGVGEEGVEVQLMLTMYSIVPLNVDKVLEENGDWQQYLNTATEEAAG